MPDIQNVTTDVTVFAPDGGNAMEVNLDNEGLVHDQEAIDNLSILATGVENDLIHKGKAWSYTPAGIITIAKQTSYDVLIVTGDTQLTLRDMSVNVNKNAAAGTTECQLFETTVTSNNGTQVYPFNNKRSEVTNVFSHSLYIAPTITSLGTKLINYLVHSDWETYIAPSYTTPWEMILKPNTKYLFRIYNNMQQALDLTFYLYFYEEFET